MGGRISESPVIGFKVTVVTGQKITALTGLCILRRGKKIVECDKDSVGVTDRRVAIPEALNVLVGDGATYQEKQQPDDKTQE
jgi:hypothetical protein